MTKVIRAIHFSSIRYTIKIVVVIGELFILCVDITYVILYIDPRIFVFAL